MRFRSLRSSSARPPLAALRRAPQAITAPTLQAKLTREMRRASAFSGASCAISTADRTLFERKADAARAPASVEKLYTTLAALMRFGAEATLRPRSRAAGSWIPTACGAANLYLRGGGDPTLDRDDLERLARALGAAGIVRVDGSVLGDETRFDALRGSYDSGGSYDSDMGGVLGALTLNRGFAKNGRPATYAAGQLAKVLRGDGIRVEGRSGAGPTPAGATQLASVDSPPMSDLVRLTNVPSDNFLAETLVKDLGAQFGDAGTTVAGVGVVRTTLARFGVHPQIVDGSGLSRADRTTPRDVVRLLDQMHHQELAGSFEGSLAVAGRTGRSASACAAPRPGPLPGQDRHAHRRQRAGRPLQTAGGHTIAFAHAHETARTSALRARRAGLAWRGDRAATTGVRPEAL
jgi:D-alanyl-D-alanine carboxypeptidase/D-alanyl-D-alanine-endopeptidase (penicillin-binding protein 4)